MVWSIDVRLGGPMATLRPRVPAVLTLLRQIAERLDAAPPGAALQIGPRSAPFSVDRWSALVAEASAGPGLVGVHRNTFGLGRAGSGRFGSVSVTVRLAREADDGLILLSFHRSEDALVSAAEIRAWADAIERASGLRRERDAEVEEPPPPLTGEWLESVLAKGSVRPDARPEETAATPPEDDWDGIPVEGWERLDLEMALTVTGCNGLTDDDRAAVAAAVRAWVEHGTDAGFGSGTFHGWIEGRWIGDGYHVDVDTGSQAVDWRVAFADLGSRLTALGPVVASNLRVVLGPPLS